MSIAHDGGEPEQSEATNQGILYPPLVTGSFYYLKFKRQLLDFSHSVSERNWEFGVVTS